MWLLVQLKEVHLVPYQRQKWVLLVIRIYLILGGYWHRQNILLTQELIHLSGQILQQFLAIHPQPVHLAVVLLQALLLVLMQVQIGKI